MELFSNKGFNVGSPRDGSSKGKKGGNCGVMDEGNKSMIKSGGLYCEIVSCPDEKLL
jgi:hypothetical protein